jgi:ABC-2 type transport system permease protein
VTSTVALIARREIVTRVQQRSYRIGLLVVLLLAVLGCTIPSLFRNGSSTQHYDVGVVADPVPGLSRSLAAVAQSQGVTITVHHASTDEARAEVRNGDWDVAVLPDRRVVADQTTGTAVKVVESAYQLASTIGRLHRAGLSNKAISGALIVTPLHVDGAKSGSDVQRQTIAIIAVVVLFSQLITFCTWVAMGVVEEKSSRVVELVLSAVRPLQLLAGKLIGIGTLAAAQVLLLGTVALIAASAARTLTIPASGIASVAVAFVGFLLGFAFFSALAAALASTVSRQEEVSGVMAPVTIMLMLCYGAGFGAAFSSGSTFARIVSVVPPFSAIAMPARIARGPVPVIDLVLAVVLLAAAATGILAVAARIYRASVLHSGTRVSLRRAWQGEAVAELG